jgi:hypothetical protein
MEEYLGSFLCSPTFNDFTNYPHQSRIKCRVSSLFSTSRPVKGIVHFSCMLFFPSHGLDFTTSTSMEARAEDDRWRTA